MPNLTTLPTELIQHIAKHLSTWNLVHLNQTCRILYHACQEPLAEKFQDFCLCISPWPPVIRVDHDAVNVDLTRCTPGDQGREISLLLALSHNPYCQHTSLTIAGPEPRKLSAAYVPYLHFSCLNPLVLQWVSFDSVHQLQELVLRHIATLKHLKIDTISFWPLRRMGSLPMDWSNFLLAIHDHLDLDDLYLTPPQHPRKSHRIVNNCNFEELWGPRSDWKVAVDYRGVPAADTITYGSAVDSKAGAASLMFIRSTPLLSRESVQHFTLWSSVLGATGSDAATKVLELCLSRYNERISNLQPVRRIWRIGAGTCLLTLGHVMSAPFVAVDRLVHPSHRHEIVPDEDEVCGGCLSMPGKRCIAVGARMAKQTW